MGWCWWLPFCSDGERAENSTKQAELLGVYTAYGEAAVAIDVTLGIDLCTRYVHAVHSRTTIISRRPEAAVGTLYIRGTIVVAPRDWRRKHSLKTEWAGAGLMVREQKTLQNRRNYWAAIQRMERPKYRLLLV